MIFPLIYDNNNNSNVFIDELGLRKSKAGRRNNYKASQVVNIRKPYELNDAAH